MNGNQGLEALAALCGGEAAVATDNASISNNSAASAESNPLSASSSQAAPSQSNTVNDAAASQARAWQAMMAAMGQNSGATPAPANTPTLQQSLALLQAAGLHTSAPAAQQTPSHGNMGDLMQSLAYLQHLQQERQNAATASMGAHLNPLLYSNPHAVALALAGQAQQLQQNHQSGDAGRQQVLPPAAARTPTAKADTSKSSSSMPPPPKGASLPSTLSTAGLNNTSPRHTAIAPLPNMGNEAGAAISESGYSSAGTGVGIVQADKKLQKRAANRRSAQLSRKRKKQFIEELKDENDELRRKEQILRSIPDLIVVFDSTGKLWFVSQSVSRFMSMTARELEGTSFWDRLCEDSVRLLKAAFMDSLAARVEDADTAPLGSGIWELRLVDKDGSHKLVTLNGVVHFSGDRPECVCSIRPRDDPSSTKRKQRKTAAAGAGMTEETKSNAAPDVAAVSISNSSGSDGTTTNESSGNEASNESSGNDSSDYGARFQPLVRAKASQSVISTANGSASRHVKGAAGGKRRDSARISDGDSGNTDESDSGSSDELAEEIAAN